MRSRGITMSQARKVVSTSKRHKLISVGMLAGLLALAASMVPASATTASPRLSHKIGGSVSLWAEWTSAEQEDFEAVLSPFESETGSASTTAARAATWTRPSTPQWPAGRLRRLR